MGGRAKAAFLGRSNPLAIVKLEDLCMTTNIRGSDNEFNTLDEDAICGIDEEL